MAEDAKGDDGDRGRLRRALNQLRKDGREERAARELQEETQQNVDEAQERAWESEQSLCSKLVKDMCSWERAIGRQKTHVLGWNETAKSIRVWAEKEEDESSSRWSGSCRRRHFLNWEISWSCEVVLKSSLLMENVVALVGRVPAAGAPSAPISDVLRE